MSLDVSDAIALAKDLLRTSNDFHAHDPDMAAQFAGRAFEICDDLGIDRTEIGETAASLSMTAGEQDEIAVDEEDDDPEDVDDEAMEISEQLRNLLQQQARVLKDMEGPEIAPSKKTRRRSFRLFGQPADRDVRELQTV